MRLDRTALIRALKTAAPIARGRSTIPILNTLLINPTTEGVEVMATNLDLQMRILLRDATDADRGFCLARPDGLVALLKASGGDSVDFTVTPTRKEKAERRTYLGETEEYEATVGGETTVRADGMDITLVRSEHAGDWPCMSAAESVWGADVGSDFMRALAAVSPAISTEETRYYLNGVYFHHVSGWTYRVVATNGHQLIFSNVEMPHAPESAPISHASGGVIIPRPAVVALLKMHAADRAAPIRFDILSPKPDNGPVNLAANPKSTRCSFTIGDSTLMTKLIDGTFPDYTRVIPAEGVRVAEVARTDMRRVVGALVGFQDRNSRAVKLRFDKDALTISANVAGQGVATMPVAAKTEGLGFEVGFNGGYLLAMCAAIGGDTVRISTADQASPCLVYDPTNETVKTVLMPLRIS